MKYLTIFIAALALSACSVQSMIEKTVPDNVRADHMAHVDSLLAKDTTRIATALDLDANDPEVQKSLEKILENVSDGKEIRRDYVSASSAISVSSREGRSHDINLTSEIQTDSSFMLVETQYALTKLGECCALINIDVTNSARSPVRVFMATVIGISKILGALLLALIVSVIFIQVKKNRRESFGDI